MTTATPAPTRTDHAAEPAAKEVQRRVIICGSTDWNEPAAIGRLLDRLPKNTVVVSGGASGADRIAAALARRKNIPFEEYPANWRKHGRGAGYRRNEAMLELDRVTHVFAFRKGDKSPRTDHMVRIAKEAGLYVGVARR